MSKCGKGWKIKCLHRKNCYTNENKPPYYAVVADKYYKEIASEYPEVQPVEDLMGKNSDVLEITPGCKKDKCLVTIDNIQPQYNKAKLKYYVPVLFNQFDALSKDDPNIYHFFKTLSRAFSFIENCTREEHDLGIDGDALKVHVYPGERFKLDIDFPGIFTEKFGRGIGVKKDPELAGAKETTVLGAVKQKPEDLEPAKPADKQCAPEHGRKVLERIRQSGFYTQGDTLMFRYMKQAAREHQAQVGQNLFYDAYIKPIADLPLNLYRNDKKMRLAGYETFAAAVGLVQAVMETLNSIQHANHKIGWYWELSLTALKFQMLMEWGFIEMDDHTVEPFVALGANCLPIKADLEIGFGIKTSTLTASLFVKFAGEGKFDFAAVYPEPQNAHGSSYSGRRFSIAPQVGGKVKVGELIKGEITLESKLTIEAKYFFTFRSRDADDPFAEYKTTLEPVSLNAIFKGGKYKLFGFTKDNITNELKWNGKIPDPMKKYRDQATPDSFRHALVKFMEEGMDWGSEKGCLIAADTPFLFHTYDNLASPDKLAAEIVRAIQHIAGEQYESCFDFSAKSAEGVFLGLVSLLNEQYGKGERNCWWGYRPYTNFSGFRELLKSQGMVDLVKNHYDPVKVLAQTMERYNSATAE